MSKSTKIALIGAGNMGGALVAGWLRTKRSGVTPQDLIIIDPAPSDVVQALIEQYQLRHVATATAKLLAEIDLAVLAVKPQALEKTAAELAPQLPAQCAILSLMAGITMTRLTTLFGDRPVVRAMSNTAAALGAGISVCVANDAGSAIETLATRLLKVAGPVEWVNDERLIGAATAVSGSGPAYVFLLAEALAGAGFAEGLPRELADKLARQTIIGAGALLAGSDKTPQELRRSVTSPGGTTQAAIDVLMGGGGGLPELVRQAVSAAERRSRQMGAEPPGR
ncbi:pyrroline-5-carboxylate reductase [Maricaulis salignorans]|uniref:Pyrroline-5-carboxylate reductase n=1 Tax=Maricaulis salignorans TaxID=144026 RepID=A0A1G9MRF2_9PROT|nr:pyrroline-5-carboxylate reductase [Maricaulis salignorans]SDL76838.1 pyrroline-5-carboxylate reductase [Maricaulis salignorans]